MEIDLQESRLWPRAQGLIWESPLGSGHHHQEKNGLQTGESCRALTGIPRWKSASRAKGLFVHTAAPLVFMQIACMSTRHLLSYLRLTENRNSALKSGSRVRLTTQALIMCKNGILSPTPFYRHVVIYLWQLPAVFFSFTTQSVLISLILHSSPAGKYWQEMQQFPPRQVLSSERDVDTV